MTAGMPFSTWLIAAAKAHIVPLSSTSGTKVVEPLKKEINAIRKELARLRRAVEKANRCPFADHADACPVLYELRRAEDVEGHAREPTGA